MLIFPKFDRSGSWGEEFYSWILIVFCEISFRQAWMNSLLFNCHEKGGKKLELSANSLLYLISSGGKDLTSVFTSVLTNLINTQRIKKKKSPIKLIIHFIHLNYS